MPHSIIGDSASLLICLIPALSQTLACTIAKEAFGISTHQFGLAETLAITKILRILTSCGQTMTLGDRIINE